MREGISQLDRIEAKLDKLQASIKKAPSSGGWLHHAGTTPAGPYLERHGGDIMKEPTNVMIMHLEPRGCGIWWVNPLAIKRMETMVREAFRKNSLIVSLLDEFQSPTPPSP